MKPLNLQEQKVKFTELMEQFAEIESPKRYHRAAFRYGIDNITSRVSESMTLLAEMLCKLKENLREHGRIMENMPPIISQKIDEILDVADALNLDMSQEEKDLFVACLFMPGAMYDGLYDKNGKIDREWLQNHLSDASNMPEVLNIPFTLEMGKVVLDIIRGMGTNEEKHEKISALFRTGGQFEGYVQFDGSVDEAKIVKKA